MFKIGEFSKIMQVSVRMLRYYDEMNILHPAMIDELSGYRYYHPNQMKEMQKVLLLRDLDFSVVEMRDALLHWHTDTMQGLLLEKQREVVLKVKAEQDKLRAIGRILANQAQELSLPFRIRKVEAMQ